MSLPVKWLLRIDAHWWMIAFWLAWIVATVLMLLPAQDLPKINIWDKAEHAGTFFALMALACLGYRSQHHRLAVLLIAYGIAIECIQFFIPSRSFSVLDMLADATGILPVYWLAMKVELA